MTLDELIARWTKKSSGFRSSEFGIGKKEGIEELLAELRDVVKQDARIAELTTEVADLKSKLDFANAMNADQDKTVARYKAALTEIVELTEETYVIGDIARNALKEGV